VKRFSTSGELRGVSEYCTTTGRYSRSVVLSFARSGTPAALKSV
jgi:hypothetical protein